MFAIFSAFVSMMAAFEALMIGIVVFIAVMVMVIILLWIQHRKNAEVAERNSDFQKAQIYCRNCGTPLKGSSEICVSCGARVGTGKHYCYRCGGRTDPLAIVCVKCGVPLSSASDESKKSKLAAGLLAIFIGTLGIHNFYLGYKWKAIAQLLITILSAGTFVWVTAIWAVIEGILILIGVIKTDAEGNFLRG